MKIGDLVLYKKRYLNSIGVVTKIDEDIAEVHWSNGMVLVEYINELEVINENK